MENIKNIPNLDLAVLADEKRTLEHLNQLVLSQSRAEDFEPQRPGYENKLLAGVLSDNRRHSKLRQWLGGSAPGCWLSRWTKHWNDGVEV